MGRLLAFEGGHFATSYRVKDRQITTVNRLLDGKNMTITVLDNERNAEGKFLPRSYTVQYWDDATGKLERTESVVDRWTRIGKWDLPTEHTVSTSSDGALSVRTLTLSGHEVSGEGRKITPQRALLPHLRALAETSNRRLARPKSFAVTRIYKSFSN